MLSLVNTLAQNNFNSSSAAGGAASAAGGLFICFIWIALIVVIVAGLWKTFDKAGQPGWAAIIPIFNIYVMCKVAGRPGWWERSAQYQGPAAAQ